MSTLSNIFASDGTDEAQTGTTPFDGAEQAQAADDQPTDGYGDDDPTVPNVAPPPPEVPSDDFGG